jgi:hypothetical protein
MAPAHRQSHITLRQGRSNRSTTWRSIALPPILPFLSNLASVHATAAMFACTTGQRDFLYFSYSLQRIDGRLVLHGSLLANDYVNLNRRGWMAIGVPPRGRHGMVGSNAIMVKPEGSGESAIRVQHPWTHSRGTVGVAQTGPRLILPAAGLGGQGPAAAVGAQQQ